MQPASVRPSRLIVMAVLGIILGVLSIILGLLGLAIGFLSIDYSLLGSTILSALGVVVVIFGLLEIVYSIGFLQGAWWSWWLGLGVSIASLVSSIGAFIAPFIFRTNDMIAMIIIDSFPLFAPVPIMMSLATIIVLVSRPVSIFLKKGGIWSG